MERLREERNWTQQEAAERCGLGSKQRWHAVVHGDKTGRHLDNVKLNLLYEIAEGLGVDPAELLVK
jgi:transcriptional regulator with XRE-family HTH domain